MGCQSLMNWAARPAVVVTFLLSATCGFAADAAAPAEPPTTLSPEVLRGRLVELDREIESLGKEADAATMALMRAQKKSADLRTAGQPVPEEAAAIARKIAELGSELHRLKAEYEKALAKDPDIKASREAAESAAKRASELRAKRGKLRVEREAIAQQLQAAEGGTAPK
jgi:chromosome segregation ATPase